MEPVRQLLIGVIDRNTEDERHFIGADLVILRAAMGNPGASSNKFLNLLTPGGYIRNADCMRNRVCTFFKSVTSYSKHPNPMAATALLKSAFVFRRAIACEPSPLPLLSPGMNLYIHFITMQYFLFYFIILLQTMLLLQSARSLTVSPILLLTIIL
jgi:hypothetical protein